MNRSRFPGLVAVLFVALAGLLPAAARAAAHEPMRNHIGLGVGIARHISDDFDDSDLETGEMGQLSYRYSLNRSVDLCIDARSFMTSEDGLVDIGGTLFEASLEHDTSWFGPGVRWSGGEGSVRPYVQANVYFVTETARVEIAGLSSEDDEDGAGFGLAGGADIRLSRLLSLPIEASYMYGKPADLDVSTLAMSVGLTFNFTPLP